MGSRPRQRRRWWTRRTTPDLLDDQITDVRKGPAYRTGGIYFTNYYAASYTPVPNNFYFTAYNMRLYAWMFALFGIAVGFIVGVQTQASLALRQWASWLAAAAVVLYPIRDVYFFWGRWMSPDFSGGWVSQVVYPLKFVGGTAMGLALLLSLDRLRAGNRQGTGRGVVLPPAPRVRVVAASRRTSASRRALA